MTTSNATDAFVWIFLPGEPEPVVAGRISKVGSRYYFAYGQSYLSRPNSISISELELPLQPGTQEPKSELWMHGCLRDGAPDAWGRRVILNRQFRTNDISEAMEASVTEIGYMLNSGSNRIGALDFQLSATEYVPRQSDRTSLEELTEAANRVERNLPLSSELDQALLHGTSLGGARPKVNITNGTEQYIAKLSSNTDTWNVVKSEFVAMKLAKLVGINCAEVTLTSSLNKDVLLVKRFDRELITHQTCRKGMISALSLLRLDEMNARYASYEDLAEIMRLHFFNQESDRRELFKRLMFNVLIGNTDDHARNHAAFWDGRRLQLTPAYDICPHVRAGNEASQAMLINGNDNSSRAITCINSAGRFGISTSEAHDIFQHQKSIIENNWRGVCDQAELAETERNILWQRAVLNPYSVNT